MNKIYQISKIPFLRKDVPIKDKHSLNGIREFVYASFNEKEIKYDVQIEFNENHSETGIYYGLRASKIVDKPKNKTEREFFKETEDQKWKEFIQLLRDEFSLFWNNQFISDKRILIAENCYPENEKDKNNKNIVYWPLWIRLDEKEEIYHAISGIMVILKVLQDHNINYGTNI